MAIAAEDHCNGVNHNDGVPCKPAQASIVCVRVNNPYNQPVNQLPDVMYPPCVNLQPNLNPPHCAPRRELHPHLELTQCPCAYFKQKKRDLYHGYELPQSFGWPRVGSFAMNQGSEEFNQFPPNEQLSQHPQLANQPRHAMYPPRGTMQPLWPHVAPHPVNEQRRSGAAPGTHGATLASTLSPDAVAGRSEPRYLLNGVLRLKGTDVEERSITRSSDTYQPVDNRVPKRGASDPIMMLLFSMSTDTLMALMVQAAEDATKNEQVVNKKLVVDVQAHGARISVRLIFDTAAAMKRFKELSKR